MIIDHWGFHGWAFYFRVIGMNSIFVYLFTRIMMYAGFLNSFLGWMAKPLGENGDFLIMIGGVSSDLVVAVLHVQEKDFPPGLIPANDTNL